MQARRCYASARPEPDVDQEDRSGRSACGVQFLYSMANGAEPRIWGKAPMAEAVWGCKPVNQFDSAAAIEDS